MKHFILLVIFSYSILQIQAQKLEYPYPVKFISLSIEKQNLKMACMDVQPVHPNGKSILLLHGKNFNGYYWKDVIKFLNADGFRVIVPDQLGFGKSDKPNIHYSFHMMATVTKQLLDSLGVTSVNVIAHSMGGMLATRFTLMYPEAVQRLIYEDPIGLEDYRTFVPYTSIDSQFVQEAKADLASITKYQRNYYPEWKPEYEQYAIAQYEAFQIPDMKTAALSNALTYDMIYQQPVIYEFKNIKAPTLIILGQEDRTVIGKKLLSSDVAAKHGIYPELGKMLNGEIKNSTLVILPGVGHIPHIQAPEIFKQKVLGFLK